MSAVAQYGTAPPNYYPENYSGSTFTGIVTDSKDDQITLAYTKGDTTDKFTGRFERGCSVPTRDKSGRKMMPSDIPKGTLMTVFFTGNTRRVEAKKIKENLILAISFEVWQGQKVQQNRKKTYFCTDDKLMRFKAW
jgi:hypothetical protein